MTWNDIFWHGVQAFSFIFTTALFFEHGGLRKLVNYLRSDQSSFKQKRDLRRLQNSLTFKGR